jgi:hypothetical protein
MSSIELTRTVRDEARRQVDNGPVGVDPQRNDSAVQQDEASSEGVLGKRKAEEVQGGPSQKPRHDENEPS